LNSLHQFNQAKKLGITAHAGNRGSF